MIAERYRLTSKLGEGGMGAVYRGVHEALRKTVAVKFLVPAARADAELVARFEREAVATANLKHPNISEATDFGQLPDGTLFLVMEYVDGKNLRELCAGGKLAPGRAFAILKQIGAALTFAHSLDVVHRDLKPDNVIVFDRGTDRDLVKVIDFGIARMSSAFGGGQTALTKAGAIFGTPDYMAPEQAMGQAVDARADQYSLGAMAYELFTGKPPYASDNVTSLLYMHVGAPIPRVDAAAPDVSPVVADVVEKMMGKLPDERYASVAEAIAALGAALDAVPPSVPVASGPVSASAVAPAPVPTTGSQSRAAPFPIHLVALGGVALVALLGGLVFAVSVTRHVTSAASSSTPKTTVARSDVDAALAQWRKGQYADAASALRSLLASDPSLAEDSAVASALASSVDDRDAAKQVDELMKGTALGQSTALSGALAEVAVHGGVAQRDGALRALHDRHGKLTAEQRARVELRDADDCDELEDAEARLATLSSRAASDDLKSVAGSECKGMLRKNKLCNECRDDEDKGGGKGHGHGHH